MTNRRPPLPPEEAEALSGEILDRAIERAGVTNAQVALAIGHAESGERHVREMRAGARAFTMRHFALLTAALPRLARAVHAEMGAQLAPDPGATPVLHAVQSAALAGCELGRVGISAAMDGSISPVERQQLRAQASRTHAALVTLEQALAADGKGCAKGATL